MGWKDEFESASAKAGWRDQFDEAQSEKQPASLFMKNMDRLLTGVMDPIYGASQFAYNTVNDLGLAEPIKAADNWLYENTDGVLGAKGGDVNQQIRDREAAYYERTGIAPDEFDGTRLLGEVASTLAIPGGASWKGAATAGGASAALMPRANTDNYYRDLATDAAAGATGGAIMAKTLPAVGDAIRRGVDRPEVQRLRKSGVVPTVGQALGGWANTAEEKMMSVPFIGDAIRTSRRRALNEWQDSVLDDVIKPVSRGVPKRFVDDTPSNSTDLVVAGGRDLAPVGGSANVGPHNPSSGSPNAAPTVEYGDEVIHGIKGRGLDAVSEAQSIISKAYDDAMEVVPGFRISPEGGQELNTLRGMVDSSAMTDDGIRAFNRFYDNNVTPRIGQGGITSDSFKRLDSEIGQQIAKTGNQEVKGALMELQATLRREAGRNSPEFAAALKDADEAYSRLVRVEGAANKALAEDGDFTPFQLLTANRAADRSTRSRKTAAGEGQLMRTARDAQEVLPNRVPNSGTTDRMLMGLAMMGTPVAPHIGLPLMMAGAGGSALNGRQAQAWLTDLLSGAAAPALQRAKIPAPIGGLLAVEPFTNRKEQD